MTVAEALRGAWEQAKRDGQGVEALCELVAEMAQEAATQRDELWARVRSYDGGDRPPAPPAALMRRAMKANNNADDLWALRRDMRAES